MISYSREWVLCIQRTLGNEHDAALFRLAMMVFLSPEPCVCFVFPCVLFVLSGRSEHTPLPQWSHQMSGALALCRCASVDASPQRHAMLGGEQRAERRVSSAQRTAAFGRES